MSHCYNCGARLSGDICPKCGLDVSKDGPADPALVAVSQRGAIICPNPNCGHRGKPTRKARGSLIVGLLLCLLFLLPGLIYLMLKSGYRYSCPKCGLQIASDN